MIADYTCGLNDSADINLKFLRDLGLTLPDAYMHAYTMAQIALAVKETEGSAFCRLPFCHTVEAEAMGGIITMGNNVAGPRAKEYCCFSIEELLQLPEIDYSVGRISEVLKACRILKSQGEHVALMISGPFTIFNVLIDSKYIYKAMRKQPDVMREVFEKMGKELLRFIDNAVKQGVDLISYADSAGGVNILGPERVEQIVKEFTIPFIRKVTDITDRKAILHLCPKTALALLSTGQARYQVHELKERMTYAEACVSMIGKISIAGQMCIKEAGKLLEYNEFREIQLI